MSIRAAVREDVSRIQALFRAFSDELDLSEDTISDAYLLRMINEHVVLVHGDMDGVVIGKINSDEGWADALFLAVQKEKQRQGIGTALMQAFEQQAVAAGVKSIDLYLHPELVAWLKRIGYDTGRTFVAMRKNLDV